MATRTKARKSAPVETEDEDVELEDLDAEVEEEAPASSGGQEVTFGVSHLVNLLKSKYKVETTPRELRSLIRKMAREDNPRVDREIVPGNRSRYDWPDGVKDPEVKRIIKAVAGGEMEADKKAKLAKLKEDKAKKAASKKATETKKASKKSRKPKPEPEELDDDEEIEEIDLDEDDED